MLQILTYLVFPPRQQKSLAYSCYTHVKISTMTKLVIFEAVKMPQKADKSWKLKDLDNEKHNLGLELGDMISKTNLILLALKTFGFYSTCLFQRSSCLSWFMRYQSLEHLNWNRKSLSSFVSSYIAIHLPVHYQSKACHQY